MDAGWIGMEGLIREDTQRWMYKDGHGKKERRMDGEGWMNVKG